jgi:acyl carrier protein
MDARARIRTFVQQQLLPLEAPTDLRDDEDLIESGILDSLALVQLVNHLEESFGMRVDAEDIDEQRFRSIDALTAYVETNRKRPRHEATDCLARRLAP